MSDIALLNKATGELVPASQLRAALVAAQTVPAVRSVEDTAKRLRDLYTLSNDVAGANEYARIYIDAARECGHMLGEAKQGKRTDLSGAPDKSPVPKQRASEYRAIAARDALELDEYAIACNEEGDIMSKAGFAKWGTTAHVGHNSGENEWYTPAEYIEAARQAMGGIDLDPASCALANETVQASRYFTLADDGLDQQWAGRVWMNPPYAQPAIGLFVAKLLESLGPVTQACVLVNNATDTAWGQALLIHSSAVCFPSGRIRFIDQNGSPSGAPLQGQMIVYFGPHDPEFDAAFCDFGVCR